MAAFAARGGRTSSNSGTGSPNLRWAGPNRLLMTGSVNDEGFPVTDKAMVTKSQGAWDGFLSVFNSDDMTLVYSSLVGGKEADHIISAHFLNQDTAFYVGADKIARILDAPVVFVSMRRERKGFYSARLHLLSSPPYDRDPNADNGAEIIERYARALEDEIRASPADWLWIHRKWKYAKPLYA